MRITVIGTYYAGLSNAILLSLNNQFTEEASHLTNLITLVWI